MGTRRFILRLAVGLLAFFIGVAAVWALGGLNPFRGSSGTRYYKHKRCGSTDMPRSYHRLERERGSENDSLFLVGPNGSRMSDPPPPPIAPQTR